MSIDDLLGAALQHHHNGEPLLAHESFEELWRELRSAGRSSNALAAKGLAQLEAALEKRGRGHQAGFEKLLAKSVETLRSARPSELGIDLVGLVESVARFGEDSSGASFDLPKEPELEGVLYLHGFASSAQSTKATHARKVLEPMRVRFRAPELDSGDFRSFSVGRALEVARRAMFERTVLVGSSLGGYVASLLANEDPRVVSLLLLAPAFDFGPRLREKYGERAIQTWRENGFVEVMHYARGRLEPIGPELIDDALRRDPRPPIRVPALIIHGRRDDTVPVSGSEAVARRDSVTLEVVDDDHSLGASLEVIERALKAAVARNLSQRFTQ
ncbi:MAG: DUF309 domain-containing protein [Deltaproteobacteria bacterium]|nr:DUF309 domain-containing protein [Deltaproteobacteria bacterium]